jgi:hypothetical protein
MLRLVRGVENSARRVSETQNFRRVGNCLTTQRLRLFKSYDRKFVPLKSVFIEAQAVLYFGRRQTQEARWQHLRIDGLASETK